MFKKWDELVFGLDYDGDRYECTCEPVRKKHDHCGRRRKHNHCGCNNNNHHGCGCKEKDDKEREKECTVKFYFDCD